MQPTFNATSCDEASSDSRSLREIISVSSEHYTPEERAIRDVFDVLQAAGRIERDLHRLMHWYKNVTINELGDMPAEKLVYAGRAKEVLGFLRSIQMGDRQ